MGQEIQVLVCVDGLFIDRDLMLPSLFLLSEKRIKEQECFVLLDLHSELDWRPHAIEVI